MSKWRTIKTVISLAYAKTFTKTRPAKGTPHRAGLAFIPLSRASKAGIQKRRKGQPCQTDRSTANASECFPFTYTTASGLWYMMLIHLRNSGSNPAVSKTVGKNRWSTLSLSWIVLPLYSVVLLRSNKMADDKLETVS